MITERFIPGRLAEIRGTRKRELAATMVLSMPIRDWSLKISGGWPTDPPEDIEGGAWAGVVPLQPRAGDPNPRPTCARASRSPRRSMP